MVKVEVCSCCAMSEAHVAEAVARIRAEHGDRVEIIERKCLDVCKESAAVKVAEEIMLLPPEAVAEFEQRVRAAARVAS